MSVWSWKVKSKLIWLLPSAPCVYKESDPRNGHWIADILSLPCHYLSLPSGAFGVPWRGWPEKEWIVSYPDPPSRQLFIEAVPQENHRNRFKMITETPPPHPVYPVPTSPPSFFICWGWQDHLSANPTPLCIPKLPTARFSAFRQGKIHLWVLDLKYEFRARKYILSKA